MYSRRTQYVTCTWNIHIEYGRIRSVHNRAYMFVKIYTSVVYILLEYDGEPFDGKLIAVKEPERSCYDLTALKTTCLATSRLL